MKATFNYDSEKKIAQVTLSKQGITVTGTAKAHPDDNHHASEFTGLTIAEMRAYKKFVERRARRKQNIQKWFLGQAEYYAQLAQEDLEVAKRVEEEIGIYIDQKAQFYQLLKSPKQRITWGSLDDIELNESFKRAIDGGNPDGDSH